MTRVLHILDHSLPLQSGYTFRTRAILTSLQKAGVEVRAITGARHSAEGPPRETIDGLTFERLPAAPVPGGPPGLREWREIETLRNLLTPLTKWHPISKKGSSQTPNSLAMFPTNYAPLLQQSWPL